MHSPMTPMARVSTAMSQREPDRVPFFLFLTYHGALEQGMSLRQYFSRAEHVVAAQLRMREKYGHDCLNPFFYGSVEFQAFGGETLFFDESPPNAATPVIRKPEDILSLSPPAVGDCPALRTVLKTIEGLREKGGADIPIFGTVISPFSLPVMQMGFDKYLDLLYDRPELFQRLMAVNEAFSLSWAKAQLKAGANAIAYVDPLASPEMVPLSLYERTGYQSACRIIGALGEGCAMGFGSAPSLEVIEKAIAAGAAAIAAGCDEDIGVFKARVAGRAAVLGNLNGVAMCRWSEDEAVSQVKNVLRRAGKGGGLVLSDSAAELPLQVPEGTLRAISEAVRQWGRYPLDWVDADEQST